MKTDSIFITFVLACNAMAAAPLVNFAETNLDLGIQYEAGYTSGAFIFTNIGDGNLLIDSAEPDCGCTSVTVFPDLLKPGEVGKIKFKIHLTEVHGSAQKGISVHSNDPNNPIVNLLIKTETKPLYIYDPDNISITLAPETITNLIVVIKRADNQKLQLRKVLSPDNSLDTDIDNQSDPSGLSVQLWIKVKPRQPGEFSSGLCVFAADDQLPSFFVVLRGVILPYISMNPEKLFWGVADPETWTATNATSVRHIDFVANHPGDILKFGKVSCNIPELGVELNSASSGTKTSIIVKMKELPKHSLSGQIDIEVDSPQHESLHVPIEVKIQGR